MIDMGVAVPGFWVQRFKVLGSKVLGSGFWVQRFWVLGSGFRGSRLNSDPG
jgi:hypothetical protein